MNVSSKAIATALVALLSAGLPEGVPAHSAGGSLGKKKIATDVYSVTCSNEEGGDTATFRLAARVRDELPRRKPKIRVSVGKDGIAAAATDERDGNRAYSPWAFVDGGNGVYRLTVTKSRRGIERYSVEFHCQGSSATGFLHTATDVAITQNQ